MGWLPGCDTPRTKVVSEQLPYFSRYINRNIVFVQGCSHTHIPPNTILSQKKWESISKKEIKVPSIKLGQQILHFLKQDPKRTYADAAKKWGITKARISQLLSIFNKLPNEVLDVLLDGNEMLLQHFNERRLRPLTRLGSDDEKIKTFNNMRKNLMDF